MKKIPIFQFFSNLLEGHSTCSVVSTPKYARTLTYNNTYKLLTVTKIDIDVSFPCTSLHTRTLCTDQGLIMTVKTPGDECCTLARGHQLIFNCRRNVCLDVMRYVSYIVIPMVHDNILRKVMRKCSFI